MADDLDVLGLLRKYEHMDKLKKQAADEIERLREELRLVKRQRDAWHADAVGLDYEDVSND